MSRILLTGFCSLPGPNRTGVQLHHVLRALVRDHTVDVLTVREPEQPYMERIKNSRILRVPMPDGGVVARVEAFRRALKRQISGADYDVVHFRDSWSGIPVLELRGQLKYHTIFDVARSPMSEAQILDLDVNASLARDQEACVLGADIICVGTEPSRRYIGARGRPDRVHLVPPGVDVDMFDWDEPAVDGPPQVLYLGALAPGRGVRILLRAIAAIVGKLPVQLVLAGPSSPVFETTLKRDIDEMKLRDHVVIEGEVDHEDAPDLISRATICVAPAATELTPKPTGLYPTKILEYMACRRAVVASRRGTVNLLMKDKVHGLLFTPGDASDLADKLGTLLRDADKRDELARRGYELVRESYTASATRRAVRGVYESVSQMKGFRRTSATPRPRFDNRSMDSMTDERTDRELIEELVVDDDVETSAITTQTQVDVTSVDVRSADAERWHDAESLDTRVDNKVAHFPGKPEWKPAPATAELTPPWEVDREGTPVDIRSPDTNTPPPVDTRFVAGEVDVPTPAPVPSDKKSVLVSSRVLIEDMSNDESKPESE